MRVAARAKPRLRQTTPERIRSEILAGSRNDQTGGTVKHGYTTAAERRVRRAVKKARRANRG